MGKDKSEIIVPDAKEIHRQEKVVRKERKESMLRRVRESYYVAGIAYAVLGVGMIAVPDKIHDVLSYLLGGVLLFYAIVALIRFFVGNDDKKNFFQLDFIVGVLVAIAGVLIIVIPHLILDLMPLVFGILLIFGSLINFQDAFELKKCQYPKWKWFMVMAGVTLIAGILLVSFSTLNSSNIMTRIIGVCFVVVGINSTVGNIAANVRGKKRN